MPYSVRKVQSGVAARKSEKFRYTVGWYLAPNSPYCVKLTMKHNLTPRQVEVVRLTSLGCTNEEAADILGLAPSTVDNHKSRAMMLLGTGKAALLTRLAIKYRISSLKDKLTRSEKRKSGRKGDGWN